MENEKDEGQQYTADVEYMAQSVKQELLDRVKEGESGEDLREWLIEHLDESIDGSARVIYTWKAKMCMVYSSNESAYFDEMGGEGACGKDGINWSALAYFAFRADVIEELERLGVDFNAPVPDCDECGSDDQDERKLVEGRWLCETCAEPKDDAEDDDLEEAQPSA